MIESEGPLSRKVKKLPWLKLGANDSYYELDMYNEEIGLAIEFNGFQHHRPVPHFGGQDTFDRVKERDAIKTEACADNGVCLIVVSEPEVRENTRESVPREAIATNIWHQVQNMGWRDDSVLTLEELLDALNLSN